MIAAAIILPFGLLFAAILAVAVVPLVVYPYWRDTRAFLSWWPGVPRLPLILGRRGLLKARPGAVETREDLVLILVSANLEASDPKRTACARADSQARPAPRLTVPKIAIGHAPETR